MNENNKLETLSYDIGTYENVQQVFGKYIWLWPFPIFPKSSQKVNGIYWPKNR